MLVRNAVEGLRVCMASAAALAILAGGPRLHADNFAQVQRAVEAGEFAQGLALARANSDPRASLREQIWVYYRARDFESAFATAQGALAAEPDDLWLAERACASALWLRDTERAARALDRFTANLNSAPADAAPPFRVEWDDARSRLWTLLASERRAQSALIRAMVSALAGLSVVLLGLAWLGSGLRRSKP